MGCYFAPPLPLLFSSLLLPRFIAFPIPILVFSSFHCSKISTSPVGYPTDPLAPSSSPTPPINNPSLSFIIVLTSLCSTLFTCISTPLLYHPRDRPLISSYTSRLMCIYSHYFIPPLSPPLANRRFLVPFTRLPLVTSSPLQQQGYPPSGRIPSTTPAWTGPLALTRTNPSYSLNPTRASRLFFT